MRPQIPQPDKHLDVFSHPMLSFQRQITVYRVVLMIIQEFEEKTIRVLVHVCSVCSERFEVDPDYSYRALKDATLHFVDEHLDLASLEWEPSGVDESDPPLWSRRAFYIESEEIYGTVSQAWTCHFGCWEGPGWYSRGPLGFSRGSTLRRVDCDLDKALQNAEFKFEQAKEDLEFLQKNKRLMEEAMQEETCRK